MGRMGQISAPADLTIMSVNSPWLALESLPVGGDALDAAIDEAVSSARGLRLGGGEPERIKRQIGSANPPVADTSIEVMAIDAQGQPALTQVSAAEVASAIEDLVDQIGAAVDRVFTQVPTERRAAVRRNGLVLTGGGAQLNGLVEFLGDRVRMPARVARDPEACVAVGTGMALDNLQVIRRGQHYIT